MTTKVRTQAVVRLEIEIATGVYGADCTMEQILSQAATEGVNATKRLLEGKGRVIGTPKVVTVTTAPETGIFDELFGAKS